MPAKNKRPTKKISATIIKKDELMALIDQLENQLAASRAVAHNLMAALGPGTDHQALIAGMARSYSAWRYSWVVGAGHAREKQK